MYFLPNGERSTSVKIEMPQSRKTLNDTNNSHCADFQKNINHIIGLQLVMHYCIHHLNVADGVVSSFE